MSKDTKSSKITHALIVRNKIETDWKMTQNFLKRHDWLHNTKNSKRIKNYKKLWSVVVRKNDKNDTKRD